MNRQIAGESEDVEIALMIGDKYLRLAAANMLQARDLDVDAIKTANQPAPSSRYLMRKISAPVKNPPHCGNGAEHNGKENCQRPKPDGMIDSREDFQERLSFFCRKRQDVKPASGFNSPRLAGPVNNKFLSDTPSACGGAVDLADLIMWTLLKNTLRGSRGSRWLPGFVAFILVFSVETAAAWGPDGHRIICEIAQIHLLPRARKVIQQNFNIKYLALVANWAEVIKSKPRKPDVLHYTNIEEGKWTYDQTRDCPDKKCVTEKIREFERVLSNKRLFYFDRKDALKFLVHLIGDIHQPMHLGNLADRGGNEIDVLVNGETMNLHALWDSGLIDQGEESLIQYAEKLDARTTDEEIKEWTKSYVEHWSNESRELSLKYGYSLSLTEDGELSNEYLARGRLIVEKQLRRAGVRLAHILNRSLL